MVCLNTEISILIDKSLRKLGKKDFAKSRDGLISKKLISYGVETEKIRKITKKYFHQFKDDKKIDWLRIVKELISKKVFEDQMAGIFLLGILLKSDRKISISEIEKLIAKYIDNWATCDAMSSEVVARELKKFPKKIEILYVWANSENMWLRRSALVTVVKLKSKIEEWQKIASKIHLFFLNEKEPIVKKAVRWLEKEIE